MLKYLFMFILFSFVGWILEFFYRGIRMKKIMNPGFMNGCVVPLYGFGAVICDVICNYFESVNSNFNLIISFFISMVVLTILEFFTGFVLDKVFHMKLWDYSKYDFNIKGYVCLQYSLIWGFLFLIYSNFIYGKMDIISNAFTSNSTCIFLLGLFYGVFLIDWSVSLGLTNSIVKYSKIIAESINLENLRFELRQRLGKRKLVNSLFPYMATSRYLRDKIKEK